MISAIKYYLRDIITLCFIAAIIFMIACAIFVIVLIAKGNIRIQMIKDEREKK